MKLVDANIPLHTVNEDAEQHLRTRRWLATALSGQDTVAFASVALLAFVRLVTRPGLFAAPLSPDAAMDRVEAWLSAGPAVVVEPTADHPRLVRELLRSAGTGGNLVTDAHLAALALKHRCVVVSYDRDLDRFPGVRRVEPPVTAPPASDG